MNQVHCAVHGVGAGSGYWRYSAAPLRYYVLSLWHVLIPLGLRFVGYFHGKKLGMVGDLPYGVAAQWRKWCLDADYLGVESERVREQLAHVEIPITALSVQDDEMMTLTGTRALFALYARAQVEVQRLKPGEHGVSAIGHFGFFRPKMQAPLWPLVSSWIDDFVRNSPVTTAGTRALPWRNQSPSRKPCRATRLFLAVRYCC